MKNEVRSQTNPKTPIHKTLCRIFNEIKDEYDFVAECGRLF